jgi:hypothetical protein
MQLTITLQQLHAPQPGLQDHAAAAAAGLLLLSYLTLATPVAAAWTDCQGSQAWQQQQQHR